MKYVLFIGHKIGYLSLKELINRRIDVRLAVIEKEHEHEFEKYFELIVSLCKENNIDYYDSADANSLHLSNVILKNEPDYILVFGYRRLIKDRILLSVNKACIACHFSLLPAYRGFAPVNWAVINGENNSGITFFHLDSEMDSGDIVIQRDFDIQLHEDINDIFEKCYSLFTETLQSELNNLEEGIVNRLPQDSEMATYTCARTPEDGIIDWNMSTISIYNLIRGLTYPFPGAFTYYDKKKLYIWSAQNYPIPKYVGIVVGRIIRIIPDIGVVVLTNDGALLIKEVQLENENRCTADKIIKSIRVRLG